VTSFQLEQARSATRRGALCACGLLLSVAVVYSTRGGNVELLTGDADPAAYKIAQARARLAASEVELKNSKERLRAIDALLAKQQADSSTSRLFKGVKQLTQSGEGLKSALLAKAENFELQADVSAASIASAHLKGQPLPSLSEQQHKIDEEDDKMFAHVLRQQAERLPGEATLPPQVPPNLHKLNSPCLSSEHVVPNMLQTRLMPPIVLAAAVTQLPTSLTSMLTLRLFDADSPVVVAVNVAVVGTDADDDDAAADDADAVAVADADDVMLMMLLLLLLLMMMMMMMLAASKHFHNAGAAFLSVQGGGHALVQFGRVLSWYLEQLYAVDMQQYIAAADPREPSAAL